MRTNIFFRRSWLETRLRKGSIISGLVFRHVFRFWPASVTSLPVVVDFYRFFLNIIFSDSFAEPETVAFAISHPGGGVFSGCWLVGLLVALFPKDF